MIINIYMLIKSVIKAGCRRLIVVILQLTGNEKKCYMWLVVSALRKSVNYTLRNGAGLCRAKKNKL